LISGHKPRSSYYNDTADLSKVFAFLLDLLEAKVLLGGMGSLTDTKVMSHSSCSVSFMSIHIYSPDFVFSVLFDI